jgi:hypothetical protein
MQIVEVKVSDEDLAARLADMRAWLDGKRFEPSTFTYFNDHAALLVRVSFKVDDEAQAFALKFGGTLRSLASSSKMARDDLGSSLGTGEDLPLGSGQPAE